MLEAAPTFIDLLRHGEPVGGMKFRGETDDPLSESGWAQMRAAVADTRRWDVVVTSPLKRCAAFAAELAARLDLPLETEERLREIGFGAWEGLTPTQVAAAEPEALEQFWCNPAQHTPPGGESLDAFGCRVAAAWSDLLQRHGGKRILVVCHGGVIRLIVAQMLAMPFANLFRLDVPYAAACRIRVRGGGAETFSELVHLGGRLGDE